MRLFWILDMRIGYMYTTGWFNYPGEKTLILAKYSIQQSECMLSAWTLQTFIYWNYLYKKPRCNASTGLTDFYLHSGGINYILFLRNKARDYEVPSAVYIYLFICCCCVCWFYLIYWYHCIYQILLSCYQYDSKESQASRAILSLCLIFILELLLRHTESLSMQRTLITR